jgi:hypothetical protein
LSDQGTESTLDQQLLAIRADDSSIFTPQEDMVGGMPIDISTGATSGFIQSTQEARFHHRGITSGFRWRR